MIKRLIDIFVSCLMLIILSPVFFIVSILIYLKMGKPIFFRQRRPGKNEKIFLMYKFRTMLNCNTSLNSPISDELRLTKLGSFLRRTSIDELPQLFNVLKGDMSLVGPRPFLVDYLPLYNTEQRKRHNVKPGITGWQQVKGRGSISWSEKLKKDIYYVDNHSLLLDLKILFMTPYAVFFSLDREDINKKSFTKMQKEDSQV